MVKVVDRSKENVWDALRQREIAAEELFGDKYDIKQIHTELFITSRAHDASPFMVVRGSQPVIEAYGAGIQDDAERLARVYEDRFEEEYTVDVFSSGLLDFLRSVKRTD